MFSKLFASAVDALVPTIKTNLELLQDNWEDVYTFLKSITQDTININIKETNIKQNLYSMLKIIFDDAKGKGLMSNGPSCLDYLLHERILVVLVEYAIKDVPKGLIYEVLYLITELFKKFPSKLLPQLTARKPMLKLIQHCLERDRMRKEDDIVLKETHISLILTIITSLNMYPELIPLFTNKPNRRSRRSSSISNYFSFSINKNIIKTEALAPITLFLVILLTYVCHTGSIGVHSRSALFELISLMSNHSEALTLLTEEDIFKELMLEHLTFQFTSMPTTFSRKKINRSDKRLSATSLRLKERFERNSIKERSFQLVNIFFELWKLINNIMINSTNDISNYILGNIITPFLNDVVLPNLHHNTPNIFCSRTMYFFEMLIDSKSIDLNNTLINLLSTFKTDNQDNNNNEKLLLPQIIVKIEDKDEEVSLVAMQLLTTLLYIDNSKVYEAINMTPKTLPKASKNDFYNFRLRITFPKSFLDLTYPSSHLSESLKGFLLLLNPLNSCLDDYFLDEIDTNKLLNLNSTYHYEPTLINSTVDNLKNGNKCSINGIKNFKMAETMASQNGMISLESVKAEDLPLIWRTVINQLKILSELSNDRIILLTGILIKLLRIDIPYLVALGDGLETLEAGSVFEEVSSMELRYGNILSHIGASFKKALLKIEDELNNLGQEVWNVATIIDASNLEEPPLLTPPSPTTAFLREKALEEFGELKQHLGLSRSKSNGRTQPKPKYGPRVETLQFVAPVYKDRFLIYTTLQEACKEISILLTSYLLKSSLF